MIPTVLLAAGLLGLLAPQRARWLLAITAALGLAWAVIIVLTVEESVGAFLGAFGLGFANAVVGIAVGAGLRRLATFRSRRRLSSAS